MRKSGLEKENLLVITPFLNRTGSSEVLKEAINHYSISYNIIIFSYEKKPDTTKINQYKKIYFAPSSCNIWSYYFVRYFNKISRIDLDWILITILLKLYSITFVHINTLLFAGLAKRFSILGIRFNLHIHEHGNKYFDLPGRNFLDQFKYAHKIFVPSNLIKGRIGKAYLSKVFVYYSIPHIKLIDHGNVLDNMWLKYSLDKFDFIWVTSGSFIKGKGVQFLLDILKFLNLRNSCLLWLGYVYDDAYTIYLKDNLREQKITNLVLPGNIEKPLYYSILKKCDAFLSLSHYESYGLSILEAYLLGLPIVAFDEIGVKEILTDVSLVENFNMDKFEQEMMKVMDKKVLKFKNKRKINYQSDTSIFDFK